MDSFEATIHQYQSRTEKLEVQLQQLRSKSRWYSTVRFVVFTGVALCLYFAAIRESPGLWLFAAVILIASFLFLVHLHAAIKYRQSVVDNLVRINHNEIAILQQNPSFLPDGHEFHQDYTYSSDLDIFGPRSLYHIIQRCFSEPGRRILARWLTQPEYDADLIRERQNAIRSIVDDIDLRQELLAHGLVHFTGNEARFDPDTPLMSSSTAWKVNILRWVVPAIMLLSIFIAIGTHDNNIILYGFLFNLVITGLFYKTTNRVLALAEQNLKTLRNYNESLKVLIGTDYETSILQDKKKTLAQAHQQFKVLQKRYDLLESRANPIMGLLLNGVFGFDFLVISRLNTWHRHHAPNIPAWEDEIGWFESVFSLGTFAWNNPSYTFPSLDREMGITGTNIRHPFIPDHENIGNALELINPMKVILLTGSNMSGKSTFLRSLGVNQVLALAGSVVAADQFHTGLYGILTSFRKADSIQEHTSLFYDELKKLQFIFRTVNRTNRPQLILLDEILRGTNSDDKYYGSKQVLLRLKDQNVMAILATHDIDLARLEDDHGPVIQNYSFESQIKDGELHFDYQLHKGVAINKNATFLMEKMGIIQIVPNTDIQ